jgi:hypothetical protein
MRKIIYTAGGTVVLATLLVLSGVAPGRSPLQAHQSGLDIGTIQSTVDVKTMPAGDLDPEIFR